MKWLCTVFICRTVKPVTVNRGIHMPSWYSHYNSCLLVYKYFINLWYNHHMCLVFCQLHSSSGTFVFTTVCLFVNRIAQTVVGAFSQNLKNM